MRGGNFFWWCFFVVFCEIRAQNLVFGGKNVVLCMANVVS